MLLGHYVCIVVKTLVKYHLMLLNALGRLVEQLEDLAYYVITSGSEINWLGLAGRDRLRLL